MKKLILLSFAVMLTNISIYAVGGVGENLATADCGDVNQDQTESQATTAGNVANTGAGVIMGN